MKLLKLKVPSCYKMLEKDFEINFLTKTRVDKDSNNDDLIELEPGFYYPKETIFVGKNSSGKSTVLSLVDLALRLITGGRLPSYEANNNGLLDLEIIIYANHNIYKYVGSFKRKNTINSEFLEIVNEELSFNEYKEIYKKDLSNVNYRVNKDFIPNIGGDTSMLPRIINSHELNLYISPFENNPNAFAIHDDLLKKAYGEDAFIKLIKVFDDSIDVLRVHYDENGNKTNQYDFKRVTDDNVVFVTADYLRVMLSSGTIRGINLYAAAIIAFKDGGTFIVDELEKNFNRNLISNLILMINDPTINKGNASIIYSTHYAELLDETNRCDNINVLHREKSTITLKNMCLDYETRTDLLKSSQFDQNAFDNNVNYNLLAELKKELRK